MKNQEDLLEDIYTIKNKNTIAFYFLVSLYTLTILINFYFVFLSRYSQSFAEIVRNSIIQFGVLFVIILPIFSLSLLLKKKKIGLILITIFSLFNILIAILTINKETFSEPSIFTLKNTMAPAGIINSIIYFMIIILVSKPSILLLFDLSRKYILNLIYCSIIIFVLSLFIKAYNI